MDFHGILPNHFVFRVVGNGFLKQMVRLMMGAVWNVGRGKTTLEELKSSLESPGGRRLGRGYLLELTYSYLHLTSELHMYVEVDERLHGFLAGDFLLSHKKIFENHLKRPFGLLDDGSNLLVQDMIVYSFFESERLNQLSFHLEE
jgi:hypothetical protein